MSYTTSYYIIGDKYGMATTVGKLEGFEPHIESVTTYTERAQLHFEANSVVAKKQIAVFPRAIGSKTYSLILNEN